MVYFILPKACCHAAICSGQRIFPYAVYRDYSESISCEIPYPFLCLNQDGQDLQDTQDKSAPTILIILSSCPS
jgi:hypothetical protein